MPVLDLSPMLDHLARSHVTRERLPENRSTEEVISGRLRSKDIARRVKREKLSVDKKLGSPQRCRNVRPYWTLRVI